MNILGAVRDTVRYRLLLQFVSDVLERVGIAIIPYYMYEETIADKLGLDVKAKLDPVVPGFLSCREVESLCLQPESKDLAMDREKLLTDDCRCFALKHNEEIVAYMLCNFRRCDSRLVSFPLSEDEVYLTGAYTFKAHRGKNLVAVLESELYKNLHAMGRRKYHSLNILYNVPSLQFKKKLQSKPSKLCLYISLFNRLRRNVTLKKYHR